MADRYVTSATIAGANGTTWSLAWNWSQLGTNWSTLNAGDTVWLAGGNYTGNLTATKGGAAGNPIIVKKVNGDAVPVASLGYQTTFSSLQFHLTNATIATGNFSNITIDGNSWTPPKLPTVYGILLTIANGGKGVTFGVANGNINGITLRNIDCQGPGFRVTTSETNAFQGSWTNNVATNILISGCRCGNMDTCIKMLAWHGYVIEYTTIRFVSAFNLSNQPHPDAIYYFDNFNGTHRYNQISDTDAECCFWDYGVASTTNISYYGNVFTQASGNSSSAIEVKSNFTFGQFFLYNNTFVGWSKGIAVDQPGNGIAAGSLCKNNIFMNCPNNWTQTIDFNGYFGSTVKGTNTTTGASDPFVSSAGFNFHLLPGSWPIGKGTTLAAPMDVDMDGVTRTAPWDLGALAFVAAGGDTTAPTPNPPLNLRAGTVTETSVQILWDACTDNVTAQGSLVYTIKQGQAGATLGTTTGVLNFTQTGRVALTTYLYSISCSDTASPANQTAFTNNLSVTTPDQTPPTNPSSLAAAVISTSQINLTWVASTDASAVHYNVQRALGAAAFATVNTTANGVTSFNNTGLSSNTLYRYQIQAVDAGGLLSPGFSNIVSATTQDQPPLTPTGLVVTP